MQHSISKHVRLVHFEIATGRPLGVSGEEEKEEEEEEEKTQ
jgi:hypothetical protein